MIEKLLFSLRKSKRNDIILTFSIKNKSGKRKFHIKKLNKPIKNHILQICESCRYVKKLIVH